MERLTKLEKETSINYNNSEPNAEIFTYDRKLITKLRKKNITLIEANDSGAYSCFIPKTWIKISTPRNLSEQSRLKLAAKAKLMGSKNGRTKT